VTATVPGMADKGWTARVAAAAGVAAGTGAAQLGLGYGLGVIVWPVTVTEDRSEWLGSLGWATWITASATVFGAVIASRLGEAQAARARQPWRSAFAISAGVGALVAVALIALPARAAVRLDVHAPIDVRVGQVFEARIAIDARAPVRDLVFAIAYEKSRLSLIRRSEGEFVRQPGVRAEYGIDEPSDGYVGVVFRAVDGSFATGAGNVVVLEFEALRPGASRIELRDVKSVAAGGEPNRNVIVTHATVTIH